MSTPSLNPQSVQLLQGLSKQLFDALDAKDGKVNQAVNYADLKKAGVADNNAFWGFNTDPAKSNNIHAWTQKEFEQYMMFSALQQSQANPMTWDPTKLTAAQTQAFDKTIADWTASSQTANASDIFQAEKPAFQAVSTLLAKQLTFSDASGNAPRTAVIALGTNDYLNPQTAGENTRKAIEAAKAKGLTPVIVP